MNLYENLGVDPDATEDEIKTAYRDKSKESHPDKGGNADEFKLVATAYEVLSDAEKRKRYDETGSAAAAGGIDQKAENFLTALFGGIVDKISNEIFKDSFPDMA